jgi:hypothetical protein
MGRGVTWVRVVAKCGENLDGHLLSSERFSMKYRTFLFLSLLGVLIIPGPSSGQGFNGRARTYLSYLDLQETVLDSLPAGEVPGEGAQRTLADGTRVTCTDEFCHYFRSGSALGIAPLIQDLELNFWTGVTGLRGYAHVRARAPLGENKLWPRSDQGFEAMAAYLEYGRSSYRVQAGRLWQTTALGFYNFDGGSLQLRLPSRLDVSVYGGLSLLRGLNQRHTSGLLSSVEPLGPQEDAYLLGVQAKWRPYANLATSITYQREESKGSDLLYSERVAGSARLLIEGATLDVEFKYDLATEATNLFRLALSAPLGAGLRATGELRKYRPFFGLWTIWGVFSPVGFREAKGRLDWMGLSGRLGAYAYGSYRKYEDTDVATAATLVLQDESWRLGGGGRYSIREGLTLDGEYRYDVGYGASRSGGDISIRRSFGGRIYLAIQGTAFETFSEFRVGSGQVFGGGLQGAIPLGPAHLQAGAMFYKHIQNERPSALDLNQARLHLNLEIPIGKDPGLSGGGNR